jgi:hypothetical protein
MANNKNKLQGLIGAGNTPAPTPPADIRRGAAYQVGAPPAQTEPELPPQIGGLSAPLQEIARKYIGARRRSGDALLEAARWLSEARNTAQHGEWQLFLEATGTTADTAERLINIHTQAMQNPQFAESVARNWLSQSAAALLARPSTPPEVITEALNADAPPSVAKIGQRIRQAKTQPTQPEANQNPQIAEFEEVDVRAPSDLQRTLEYDQSMIEELFDRWRALGAQGEPERILIREALRRLARQAQQLSNDLD